MRPARPGLVDGASRVVALVAVGDDFGVGHGEGVGHTGSLRFFRKHYSDGKDDGKKYDGIE